MPEFPPIKDATQASDASAAQPSSGAGAPAPPVPTPPSTPAARPNPRRRLNPVLPPNQVPAPPGPPAPPPAPPPRNPMYDALNGEGFTDQLITAFLDTAVTTKCAVSTRTPGRAGRRLIAEHHDLKSFSIKAKSCDWGPMEGFICTNPWFNKKGAEGAAFNIKHLEHYLKELAENPTSLANPDPSVILKISDARKAEVLDGGEARGLFVREQSASFTSGLAYSGDKSVAVQFIMKKGADNYWQIYHRAVFVKSSGPGYEREAVDPKWWGAAEAGVLDDEAQSKALDEFTHTKVTLALLAADVETIPKTSAYPIRGLMNANPPYRFYQKELENPKAPVQKPADLADRLARAPLVPLHKDAVSGDFDLFAVWPRIAEKLADTLTADELIRRSDDATAGRWSPGSADGPPKLFQAVRGRTYAVEAVGCKKLFLEIAPWFDEMAKIEDKQAGNCNDAVAHAAGMLNSWVGARYLQEQKAAGVEGVSPNAAFHSDECGRPGVFEFELPVAVFLPTQIQRDGLLPLPRITLIREVAELPALLEIVRALRGKFFLTLHYGWLRQLFDKAVLDAEALGDLFLGSRDGLLYRDAVNKGDTRKPITDENARKAAAQDVGQRLLALFRKYNPKSAKEDGTEADAVKVTGCDEPDKPKVVGDMTILVKEFLDFRTRVIPA